MTADPLLCTRCQDEGHLIRVAPGRLAALHLTRHDHPFRIVRLAQQASTDKSLRVGVRVIRQTTIKTVPPSQHPPTPRSNDDANGGVKPPAAGLAGHRRRSSEGPDMGREDFPGPGSSSRTPNRTRPAGNGRPRTASPSEVIEPSSGARARRAGEPPSRSVSGSAGRSRPTAGEGASAHK